MIYEIEPYCYKYGMMPNEFWNSTYRQLHTFVDANAKREEAEFKRDIILHDALGEKIISAIAKKRPQNISLIEKFGSLFEEELKPATHQQTPEEQIRILRSMK